MVLIEGTLAVGWVCYAALVSTNFGIILECVDLSTVLCCWRYRQPQMRALSA